LTFDREGRLHLYFRNGLTYKRSLSSDVHLRFRQGGRQRRKLSSEEALAIFSEAYALAIQVHERASGELRDRLSGEILRWTPQGLAAERRRFLGCYRPISILPPDQYLSIVLQATEGCSWNRCTFCSFYMDRTFAARTPEDFRKHALAVRELLGAGIELRRGVFLADGNALALSSRRLEPLVAAAREVFPGRALFGFVDLFSGERLPTEHWTGLSKAGLERVYIGMETGSDELLARVNKPGSAAELIEFVGELKAAELAVGLILMVGLGGLDYKDEHARASIEVLKALPLSASDVVYLSPFVAPSRPESDPKAAASTGSTPMSEDEIEAETRTMAAAVRRLGIRTSRYDIREFIY
jgi:radical SAM superfamily enzyme YgiQ (UPF0313 family)